MDRSRLMNTLVHDDPSFQVYRTQLANARTLVALVLAVWSCVRALAIRLLEDELHTRSQACDGGCQCPVCGRFMDNKGMKPRRILTLFGQITWRRRIRTCTKTCGMGQVAVLDTELGLVPYQQTSWEVQRLACLLSVVMPFSLACDILSQLTGVTVCPKTVWNWVQGWGERAMAHLQKPLDALAEGEFPKEASMSADEHALPLLVGADGVMVPFRPNTGTAKGKTRWREVKVGILARLTHTVSHTGTSASRLVRRRLVAVLGDIDALQPRLWREALRQGILTSSCVVWLSDGGRGFWRLFEEQFAPYAIGILDVYHAAQHLWKGAKARFDGRTVQAKTWFTTVRHQLRHGNATTVRDDLNATLEQDGVPDSVRHTLSNVLDYVTTHQEHTEYARWKDAGIPIGSGMVESACKWLIQQRFKGVGMRWSEDGFTHLLHLRLFWANGR